MGERATKYADENVTRDAYREIAVIQTRCAAESTPQMSLSQQVIFRRLRRDFPLMGTAEIETMAREMTGEQRKLEKLWAEEAEKNARAEPALMAAAERRKRKAAKQAKGMRHG